jgi:hypothetical protein
MENSCIDSNKQLVLFLRELSTSIESNKLSSNQLRLTGEFFMNYKFNNEIDKEESLGDMGDMDVVRFLSLGWYMYKVILSEQTNPTGAYEENIK